MNKKYNKIVLISTVLIAALILNLFISTVSTKWKLEGSTNGKLEAPTNDNLKTTTKDKLEAIAKVKSKEQRFKEYPDKAGKVQGPIFMGGPKPENSIPGVLETKVEEKLNGIYQVTFTEYWNSKDFKYEGSKDGTQSHFNIYEVTGNEVKFIKNGGDFPPEQVK